MIRPITVICWILALGAGLYLYRAKHEVELMDKHIEQIAKETSDIRTESRRRLDDWIRLGEPEQLHKYSDEYLGLKTIAPTQFARLSDLATRLPAPQADPPDEIEAVAQTPEGQPPPATIQADAASTDATDEADGGDLPVPPIPPTTPLLTKVSLPGVTSVPLQARPVTPRLANVQSDDKPRANAETRMTDEPRAVAPKPLPLVVTEPRQPAPEPANGQSVQKAHELPPLQAQAGPAQVGYAPAQGGKTQSQPREIQTRAAPPPQQPRSASLPPLQAQGASPPQNPGQPYSGQPVGRTIPWSGETHVADTAANDPRREVRPTQPSFGDPRGPQVMRQAPAPTANGSLLGMPRGPVPLPLPAPTPVSATWAGSPGQAR